MNKWYLDILPSWKWNVFFILHWCHIIPRGMGHSVAWHVNKINQSNHLTNYRNKWWSGQKYPYTMFSGVLSDWNFENRIRGTRCPVLVVNLHIHIQTCSSFIHLAPDFHTLNIKYKNLLPAHSSVTKFKHTMKHLSTEKWTAVEVVPPSGWKVVELTSLTVLISGAESSQQTAVAQPFTRLQFYHPAHFHHCWFCGLWSFRHLVCRVYSMPSTGPAMISMQWQIKNTSALTRQIYIYYADCWSG